MYRVFQILCQNLAFHNSGILLFAPHAIVSCVLRMQTNASRFARASRILGETFRALNKRVAITHQKNLGIRPVQKYFRPKSIFKVLDVALEIELLKPELNSGKMV